MLFKLFNSSAKSSKINMGVPGVHLVNVKPNRVEDFVSFWYFPHSWSDIAGPRRSWMKVIILIISGTCGA